MCNQGCKFCNNCEHLEVELENFSAYEYGGEDYYTFYCRNTNSKYKKAIDYYVTIDELIPSPAWCALKNKDNTDPRNIIKNNQFNFKNIGTLCNWDNIKEGDVYHLPPNPHLGRCNLQATYCNNYCATFKVLIDKNNVNTRYITIYKTDISAKLLIKRKTI